LTPRRRLVDTIRKPLAGETSIAIVGKYVELEDSYKSLREALTHGGVANDLRVNIRWIESEELMGDNYEARLRDFDAILVPGGFGKRGVEGMIRAISYARRTRTPYFGICLGMQTACVEFARDRKSTRLNSSHGSISYAVFCLKKKVVSIGHIQKLHAVPAQPGYGFEDIAREQRDMLHAGPVMEIEILLDLALLSTLGRLLDRELDGERIVGHHDAHQGAVLGGNIFVIKAYEAAEAQHATVPFG